jgi:hypothetical protein
MLVWLMGSTVSSKILACGYKEFFFLCYKRERKVNRGIFLVFFFFYVLYSTLLHLPPLRFHCVGGCWDRTQDCCDFGIGSQTL